MRGREGYEGGSQGLPAGRDHTMAGAEGEGSHTRPTVPSLLMQNVYAPPSQPVHTLPLVLEAPVGQDYRLCRS